MLTEKPVFAEPAAPVLKPGGIGLLSAAEAMRPVLDADAEVTAPGLMSDSMLPGHA